MTLWLMRAGRAAGGVYPEGRQMLLMMEKGLTNERHVLVRNLHWHLFLTSSTNQDCCFFFNDMVMTGHT